jgi:hypothetical protein
MGEEVGTMQFRVRGEQKMMEAKKRRKNEYKEKKKDKENMYEKRKYIYIYEFIKIK